MYATGVNMYIYYVCTGVRCKVCVWWEGEGEGGGSVNVGRCQILTSLNPLAEVGGAQPIMNDQETILIVQKFNTRGLALGKIKLISHFYKVHEKT